VTLEDTAEQARVSAKTASNVMGQRPARPTLLPAELQDVHRVQ
jgi:DNA-binding LacI/PurR family transcriptional regulator